MTAIDKDIQEVLRLAGITQPTEREIAIVDHLLVIHQAKDRESRIRAAVHHINVVYGGRS